MGGEGEGGTIHPQLPYRGKYLSQQIREVEICF